MERLSSCYFCAASVDAPLDEYPVVPRDLEPDPGDGPRITLCPTCHRKLGAVLDHVVEAVEAERSATESGPTADGESDPDADGDGDDLAAALADVELPVDPARSDDTAGDDEDAGRSRAEDADGRAETVVEDGSRGPSHRVDRVATSADDAKSAESARSDGEKAASGAQSLDAEIADGISALEYNKVVRLLRNREAPVERTEIEAIATSAYGVSPEAFDAIVDAAIGRGIVAEDEEGRLVGR